MQFENIFEQVKQVIPQAIRKCRIYKNFEHYEQIGREAIWHAYQKFSGPPESFPAYAYVFVRNAILNELRKVNRIEQQEQLIDDTNTFELLNNPPMRTDLSYPLSKLLSHLKQEDQKLLYLLYVEQYSYEEVAEILNISIHALKKRRDRLLKKLRLRKAEFFVDM